jgi:antirestriction protein ArdC
MAKFDIYEAITDRILIQLESGIIPWTKPWVSTSKGSWSRSTGRCYSFINQMLLGNVSEYATYKQIKEAGGEVKKGSKAKFIVFWKMIPIETENSSGVKESKVIPFLKYINVFDVANDCENIEIKYKRDEVKPFDSDVEAEEIINEYSVTNGVKIYSVDSDRAFYRPSDDSITLPTKEQFKDKAEYYSTAFHEIAHSTGHPSRLARINKVAAFGSEEYSKEELVAEISAASILNYIGLETKSSFKNNAAYIQSWIRALNDDKKLIVSASSKAEKAVELILGSRIQAAELS